MDKKSNLTERLKELMFEKEIKSEELAKALGINGTSVRDWLLKDTSIRLTNLIKLSDFFDCSIEYLVGRSEDKSNFVKKTCSPFMERLKMLLIQNNKSFYSLNKETTIKYSSHTRYRKGVEPSLETLIILADYLDCTIDYLVGRES